MSPVAYGVIKLSLKDSAKNKSYINESEVESYNERKRQRYFEDQLKYKQSIAQYRNNVFNRVNSGNEDAIKILFECADYAPDIETKKMCLDLIRSITESQQAILNMPTFNF